MVWLHHVVSWSRSLDLVGEVLILGEICYVEGGLELAGGVPLDGLEAELLVGDDRHKPDR